MSRDVKSYRIFIASPGGLETERKAIRDVVEEFNQSSARLRDVVFDPIGWEFTLPGMGRPQSVINTEVRSSDYFMMVLHDRWGMPTDSGDNPRYLSGTHEEYCVAIECYNDAACEMKQVVLFFKALDPTRLSDPGGQLRQVLSFRSSIEDERRLLYGTFDSLDSFRDQVRRQLDKWLFDHENGKGNDKIGPSSPPPAPNTVPRALEIDVSRDSVSPSIELLNDADRLAEHGKFVEAETKFAQAVVAANDVDALNRYGNWLVRIGRLAQAEVMYLRVCELGELLARPEWEAVGCGNLAHIYQTRGDLIRAEQLTRKAMKIYSDLGRSDLVADQESNLGVLYQARGEFERANEMFRKALVTNELLGRSEEAAHQFANLGLINEKLGNFQQAEEMHRAALSIFEQYGQNEGIAGQYGSLGTIYHHYGDQDMAEEMLKKSLAILEQLGAKEGMAIGYGNLGTVYLSRGELERAEEMYRKSLALNEELGRKEGMASQYSNLAVIHGRLGNDSGSEQMHRKSLEINEQLGRKDAVASQFANLGGVYARRGDFVKAQEYWKNSRDIYEQIGVHHLAMKVQTWIDEQQDVERKSKELP
jgi:tetratricopeptide (TPR) repeat protein